MGGWSTLRFLASQALLGGRRPRDVDERDLRLMRITGTVEYVAGFFTLITVTQMPDRDPSDHQAYLQLAAVGLLFAALRWLAPLRLWAVYLSLAAGYLYIAAIVSVARPLTATPYFFIWPTLTAGYFLGRRGLAAATVAFAASLTISLSLNPTTTNLLQEVFPTLAVVTTVSLLVGGLREHVDRLVRALEHSAATDTLTGLTNRRTFEEAVDRELSRVAARGVRSRSPSSISITSRPSTTRWGMPPAMWRCDGLPRFSAAHVASATSPRGWAARSSASCSPTPTRRAHASSPTGS